MTDQDEGFLARWSKRKAEARLAETDAEAAKLPADPVQTSPAGEDRDEAEVPLEDLPPIDSITAETDLTPWLRKKLPEGWKRAALSRTWASDPAISQFIGLAENTWDWNAPDGVPGFGPLRATDNVGQLLAQAVGSLPKEVAPGPREAVDQSTEVPSAEEKPAISAELPKEPATASFLDEGVIRTDEAAAAPAESAAEEPRSIKRRRSGGALPS
jgi:hypothetical protein